MNADGPITRRTMLTAGVTLGAATIGGATTNAVFSDTASESGSFTAGTWDAPRVSFTVSESLKSVSGGKSVVDHSPTAIDVIGSPTAQLSGDYAIPFFGDSSLATGALQYVDNTGSLAQLSTDGTTVRTKKSLLATDSWDGSPDSVFYAGGSGTTLYRVAPSDSTPTTVRSTSNGVTAVLGASDVDGDGTTEFVYVDGSATVRYLKPGDSTEYSIGGVGSNKNYAAGTPASFPSYGIQTPVVDGSNNVAVMSVDGTKTTLTSSGPASKAPVAGRDIDNDDEVEVVFADTGGTLTYVDDVGGSPTTKTVTDDTGSAVTGVDGNRGVQ